MLMLTKEEYREREARRLNLIIHRVKEPRQEIKAGEERRMADTEECTKIFSALGLEEEAKRNIKHCRRIEERTEEPRPLVVVLRTEDTKRKIMEAARNLKNTKYREVGIVPDMTVQQRREEQSMVEEVERRN